VKVKAAVTLDLEVYHKMRKEMKKRGICFSHWVQDKLVEWFKELKEEG